MMPKPEQANLWSSQEAAIKAEITEAKNTVDLIRMAQAIARLDALHSEMEAASIASLRPYPWYEIDGAGL
jgi:hypothetical protein